MTSLLPTLPRPLIVSVDTNSWMDPVEPSTPPDLDTDWRPEHAFVERNPPHGLVDVHRSLVDADPHRSRLLAHLRPEGPMSTTFVRRPHRSPMGIAGSLAAGRSWGLDRMDRLYVSPDIAPLACEHLYHEARDAGGDHAAVVADLGLPG